MTDIVGQITGVVFGACVGSFLNVVIWRLPRRTFVADGARSICPHCREPIPWYRNLPVLSWVLLRGRAACCAKPISGRYPLVEALTALLFWALVQYPPSGIDPWPPSLAGSGAFLLHAFLVSALVACTFIDIDHQILPDRLTKPSMVVGVLGAFVVPSAYGRIEVSTMPAAAEPVAFSVVGLLAGFGITWGIRALATLLFRKEAMGRGDVKFMAAIGAFLGWQNVLLTFFVGCVLGAFGGLAHRLVTGQVYICFGPFLAAGALCALFFAAPLVEFLFVTWPRWQESRPMAPVLILGIAGAALLFLFIIIRRGRNGAAA